MMPVPVREWIAKAKAVVTCISAREAARQIREVENVLLLDVREPEEHAQAALPGALNVPRGVLELKIERLCPDEERPILIHCGGGGRAALAARTLQEMGYRKVCSIDARFADVRAALAEGAS